MASFAEVPLLYPCQGPARTRFVVHDQAGSLERISTPTAQQRDHHEIDAAHDSEDRGEEDSVQLLGAASTSCLGNNVVVTTCGLLQEPTVVLVSLLRPEGTSSIELDLGQTQIFGTVVKIQCFSSSSTTTDDDSLLILRMVDTRGIVLSITLKYSSSSSSSPLLIPVSLSFVSIPHLVESQQGYVAGAELNSSMITFVSSSVLIVALAPDLVAVHLADSTTTTRSPTIHIWSQAQTMEDMKSRGRNTIGSMFSRASDLLLGNYGDEDNMLTSEMMDMPPTAALCHVGSLADNNDDENGGGKRNDFVFSLHSDASIRRWRIRHHDDDDATSTTTSLLYPSEVVLLTLDQQAQRAIPEPSLWSDSNKAVSLCAQLYHSVYALAVHVQTVAGGAAAADESTTATLSPCHLTVLHGSSVDVVDEGGGGDNLVRSVLQLQVPKAATSLVGLDLARERCRLTALFQSQETNGNNDTGAPSTTTALLVTYPPSVMSIVSTEPIVTPHENTLDGVAATELARLSRLDVPIVLNDATSSSSSSSLEDDLHAVDTAFLKYLFRPAFPRGTATVTPSSSSIRAVIGKLVPGVRHYSSGGSSSMSIELETLRAMQEWRRLENRRVASPAPRRRRRRQGGGEGGPSGSNNAAVVATPGGSVYDCYARQEVNGTPDMDVDESDVEEKDEEDLFDQERADQVEAHEKRWHELLLAVWQEEGRVRNPLCISNMQSTDGSNFVLVRAGVTSLLHQIPPVNDVADKWEVLDRTAMIMLGHIEKNEDALAQLNSVETQLYEEIARASLVFSAAKVGECADALVQLGRIILDHSNELEINVEDHIVTLRSASEEETLQWLESIVSLFSLRLPGASVLPDSALVSDKNETWSNRIADVQTRLAASSLFVQFTDSVRRLSLARFLLVSIILDGNATPPGGSSVPHAAYREYLHSISVLWTCAQRVPMPTAGLVARKRNVGFIQESSTSDPPPSKRLIFGDTASSILLGSGPGSGKLTTALDARFIQISQEHFHSMSERGFPENAITAIMVRICVNSTFPALGVDSTSACDLSSVLPELGVLPVPYDDSVASDYPRLALRLIAPIDMYSSSTEEEDVRLARKEALAECLLIEANAESQKGPGVDTLVTALRSKSCELLAPQPSEITECVGHNLLETAFTKLRSKSEALPEPELEEIDSIEMKLSDEFKKLLDDKHRPETEIARLCQQPTVRSLFGPLTAESFSFSSLDELSRSTLKSMIQALLRISQLMHRLSILERHTDIAGGLIRNESSCKSNFLLVYIEQAIAEVQRLMPKKVYLTMTEYSTLWTLLFNHSVSSRKWRTAHNSCVYHPIPERRVEYYKRLVFAMANAGALADLFDLCALVTYSDDSAGSLENGGVCIDLYEIAAETLAEARGRNLYENGSVSTDYLGCLYALHAFRGRWERAAQAMDAKYEMALKAISSSMGQADRLASVVNVTAAANDLVLASLFTSNALQLVDDPSKRFVVSGEVGPFPSLPFLSDSDGDIEVEAFDSQSVTNKRGRNDQESLGWVTPRRVDGVQTNDTSDADRLSRFMTVADLNARAARAIALWTFLHDDRAGEILGIIPFAKSPSSDSDHIFIDRLVSLGYFDHAILFAKACDCAYEERGCHVGIFGHDLLQDAVIHILTCILPVALNQASSPSEDSMESDHAPGPTLSQLRRTIEEIGVTSEYPFSFVVGETWYPRSELPSVAASAAAMELARKLTTEFAGTSSPIALEVVGMILNIDPSGAAVPLWLERLLLGYDDEAIGDSSGLFARKASADGRPCKSDPGGLVSLYTRRGLYSKACNVVSVILSGALLDASGQSRETQAPSRLPEKGDIDFVPYDTIDLLWTLIDRALANRSMNALDRTKLEESRKRMEYALEKHFDLMKISEQGMRSARALRT